jgi:hypothetical protein
MMIISSRKMSDFFLFWIISLSPEDEKCATLSKDGGTSFATF